MKELKDYINESIWDVEDNIEDDNKDLIKEQVIKFINDHYSFSYTKYYSNVGQHYDFPEPHIKLIWKNNKYIIDVPKGSLLFNDGDIRSSNRLNELTNGYFEWGKIYGYFDCGGTNLISLKGAPKEIDDDFNCSGCKNLESLEGSPEKVGGCFLCKKCDNSKFASLKGAPEEVDGDFDCRECKNLESLEGSPKYVGGNFNCADCQMLESLEGAPKEVDGDFSCPACVKLESLIGAPEKVKGSFSCVGCKKLTSLKGSPKIVNMNFECRGCSITSLDGIGKVRGEILSDVK